MATRTARLSKLDKQGQLARQIGWKLNSSGKRIQHKFRLGTDRTVAERRDHLLRQLWARIEKDASDGIPLWDDQSLAIVRQIARGEEEIKLLPLSTGEANDQYAQRLQGIQNWFPFLRFIPGDEGSYLRGIGD